MRKLLISLVAVLCMTTVIEAQECYTPTYKQGQRLYRQGEYTKALAAFKAALNCPDKPEDNDLKSWIQRTESRLRSGNSDRQSPRETPSSRKPQEKELVYRIWQVDKAPQFPGGQEVLDTFIKNVQVYPEQAKMNDIEGIVDIEVVLDKNGKLSNPRIIRSVDSSLDKEALRILSDMPDWIPGEIGGKAVSVYQKISIPFILKKIKEPIITKPLIVDNPEKIEKTQEPGLSQDTMATPTGTMAQDRNSNQTKVRNYTRTLKKHQFAIDLGLGSWEAEIWDNSNNFDSYSSSMFCVSINARYLFNFSRFVATDMDVKIMSDFAEMTAFMGLGGLKFTTPTIGKTVSLYLSPKVGYGLYEDYGESGFTFEIEAGVNIKSRYFIGYSFLGGMGSEVLDTVLGHNLRFGFYF